MASNETIKNLTAILGALSDYNAPRREVELYAKKRLIDFNMEKKLLDLELEQAAASDKAVGIEMAAQLARDKDFGIVSTPETSESLIKKYEDDKTLTPMDIIRGSMRGPGLQGSLALTQQVHKEKVQNDLSSAIDLLATNVYKGTMDETGIPNVMGTFTTQAGVAKGQMKTELLEDAAKYKSQINRILNSSEYKGENLLDENLMDKLNTTNELLDLSIDSLSN